MQSGSENDKLSLTSYSLPSQSADKHANTSLKTGWVLTYSIQIAKDGHSVF